MCYNDQLQISEFNQSYRKNHEIQRAPARVTSTTSINRLLSFFYSPFLHFAEIFSGLYGSSAVVFIHNYLLSRRKFTSVKSTMNRTEQYSLNIPDKKEFYNSRPLWLSHSVNHAISCESCHLNTSKQFRYISNWTMTN